MDVTNLQLYLAIGIPIVFNAAFTTLLFLLTWRHFDARINDMNANFNARFEDMKEMWRTELKRLEEVMDARLKHLEERR